MYFKYDEKLKLTMCYTENKDECSVCINFDICPLITGIEKNLVIPHYENIVIKKCPLQGKIEEIL